MYPRVFSSAASVGLWFALSLTAGGQDAEDPPRQPVEALQQRIQKAIEAAEPSVVAITVSRSGDYQRFGLTSASPYTGQLGGYWPEQLDAILRKLDVPDVKRREIIKRLDLADPENVPEVQASGTVIDARGLILTNYHVVRGATKVYVRLGKRRGSYADILAADPRSDLAVLRLLEAPVGLKPIQLGSGDRLGRGRFVVAMHHAATAGFQEHTCDTSWGMISNVRRKLARGNGANNGADLYQHIPLLQIDVRGGAGSSGGALVDLDGSLAGVLTSLGPTEGGDRRSDFAVPLTADVRRIVETLRRGEEVEYGYLGARATRAARRFPGAEVAYVVPGSPADLAGIRTQDVILAVNDQKINDADDLDHALAAAFAGAEVKFNLRKGRSLQRVTVSITLAKLYVPGRVIAMNSRRPFVRGLRVDDVSLLVQTDLLPERPERIPQGAMIAEVQPDSPAATVLLKAGDVITHVNGQPVRSPREFYERVRSAEGVVELTLLGPDPGQPAPKVLLRPS